MHKMNRNKILFCIIAKRDMNNLELLYFSLYNELSRLTLVSFLLMLIYYDEEKNVDKSFVAAHSCTLYYIMYSNCQGLYSNGDNILRNNFSNLHICWSFSCAIWSISSFLCMLQTISGQRKETDLLLHSNNIPYSTILKNYKLYYYSKFRFAMQNM